MEQLGNAFRLTLGYPLPAPVESENGPLRPPRQSQLLNFVVDVGFKWGTGAILGAGALLNDSNSILARYFPTLHPLDPDLIVYNGTAAAPYINTMAPIAIFFGCSSLAVLGGAYLHRAYKNPMEKVGEHQPLNVERGENKDEDDDNNVALDVQKIESHNNKLGSFALVEHRSESHNNKSGSYEQV